MKKSKIDNYQSALTELQSIVDQLQSEEIPIDELSTKIARAKTLITFCREKLRHTETEIDQVLGS